jgi:hypothetical protein
MLVGMSIPDPMLQNVITLALRDGGPVAPQDARRVLEIACLAVASDGKLADEELAAIRVFSTSLGAFSRSELDALVLASLNLHSRDDRLERLRAAADALTTEGARHLAYKLSVVTALSDLASADEEFEFDLDVQDALKLDSDVAERLSGEVHEALMPAD